MNGTSENEGGAWTVEKALPLQLFLNLEKTWLRAGYGCREEAIDAVNKEIEKLNMPFPPKNSQPD